VASLSIEDRLLHYFLAMGAEQAPIKPASATLSFAIDEQRVNVVVMKNVALTRGVIIQAILGLGSLRAVSNQLYLVVPRLLGVTVDAEVLRSYGIGLLMYDDRRIDEVLPPQLINDTQTPICVTPDPSTTARLTELTSMYLEMKSIVMKLREEMKTLQQIPQQQSVSSIEAADQAFMAPGPVFNTSTGHLPSFFTDNPWLDVLSKRAKQQGEPFAG